MCWIRLRNWEKDRGEKTTQSMQNARSADSGSAGHKTVKTVGCNNCELMTQCSMLSISLSLFVYFVPLSACHPGRSSQNKSLHTWSEYFPFSHFQFPMTSTRLGPEQHVQPALGGLCWIYRRRNCNKKHMLSLWNGYTYVNTHVHVCAYVNELCIMNEIDRRMLWLCELRRGLGQPQRVEVKEAKRFPKVLSPPCVLYMCTGVLVSFAQPAVAVPRWPA